MDKLTETDSEDLFEDEGTVQPDPFEEEEQKDDANDQEILTLEKLNSLAGRTGEQAFKSIGDFEKHYGNLKSFVGKKQETAKPATKETSGDRYEELKREIEALKAEKSQEGFLTSFPEAKEHLDLIEAYAEKKGLSLSEAWEQKKDVFSRNEVSIKPTNRHIPIQPKDMDKLRDLARRGDINARQELVRRTLHSGE
jgi:hypothetical protein